MSLTIYLEKVTAFIKKGHKSSEVKIKSHSLWFTSIFLYADLTVSQYFL